MLLNFELSNFLNIILYVCRSRLGCSLVAGVYLSQVHYDSRFWVVGGKV